MQIACNYHFRMSRMIQIRNVPDDLHRTLKARAALAGQALSSYLLSEIQRIAERPSEADLRNRLRRRTSIRVGISPADAVRAEREKH